MKSESCSVMSDSLQPYGLYSPWNSPGQNTGVGRLSLSKESSLSRGSSQSRDQTQVSCIAGRFFTSWATKEARAIQNNLCFGLSSQGYGFSSSHVWMWELDYKESRAQKNWCFWTVVLEKTLESPLDCKEIHPVHSKDQSWMFIGRTDAEAETPILGLLDEKNWLFRKDPDAGKDWRQEETRTREDEVVGWHHWLGGHEFE